MPIALRKGSLMFPAAAPRFSKSKDVSQITEAQPMVAAAEELPISDFHRCLGIIDVELCSFNHI